MSGASITVRIDAVQAVAAFRRLSRLMDDTTPVMDKIGKGLVDGVKNRFQAGVSPEGAPWAKLNPVYASGKRGAGILRETNALMNSMTSRPGRDQVIVGTNRIQAAVHQFGATITPKAGQFLIFRMGGRMAIARSVTLPARPYLGISADDVLMIGDVLDGFLGRAIGAGGPRRR